MANPISGFFQKSSFDRIAGLLLLTCFIAIRIWDPSPVEILRLKGFDFFQQLKPREASQRVVSIIDIDEESLNEYGQWPWARTRIADLVDKATKAGAAAIGFDILFPEHDRLSPAIVADALRDVGEPLKEQLRELPSNDQQLAAAMKRSRVVLGQSAYHREIEQWHAVETKGPAMAMLGPNPSRFLYSYPGLIRNVPELEQAASGRGLVTIRPEADGVVRRVPAMMVIGKKIHPAITVELLRVATGTSTLLAKSDDAGVQGLVLAGTMIPTDGKSRIWVNFSRHEKSRFISAKDILEGKLAPGALRGKLVLVGTSAVGLFDLKATPLDPVMPGVEIHAQLLENILTGSMLTRPNWAIGAELLVAAFTSLVIIAIVPFLGALWSLVAGALLGGAFAATSYYLYTEKALVLDVTFPLFTGFSTFALLVFLNYFHEETQRRQIRGAFGQYLSPDLVNQLASDPDRLVLGGETKEMTILFSDVRDFTSISETYKENPQGLTQLINRLLTPLSKAVVNHHGTIDKYMGDNVMAFWNAPLDDEKHAENSCGAALTMMASLERVNEERAEEAAAEGETVAPLAIGIGIGSGECVVGNMGSDLRFDYTVLGDVVNLSSRLEGQSKSYGVISIVAENTATAANENFALLEVDLIRVKGKTEPEKIFTLIGGKSVLENADFQKLRGLQDEFLSAYRSQDWKTALAKISACRKFAAQFNLERLYEIYEARVRDYEADPPDADWQGVFVAREK
ncbi:MAG: CHASE2 domain-containing protein [Hyphomicrobiales bacterium]